MKTVEFAKPWRNPLSETSVEEYEAGAIATISNARAAKAEAEGVLVGPPADADGDDED